MALLESGPAKTDRYYWLVVTVAFAGFAGWCVYDWSYRYLEQNRAEAAVEMAKWTDVTDEMLANLPVRPTEEDVRRVRAAKPDRETLKKEFGEALPPKMDDVSPIEAERYVSLYGMVTVELSSSGRPDVARMTWQGWEHSPDDIRMQLYMAIGVGLVAFFFLVRTYRAFTLRAEIDEEGMTYGGVRIPFADMVSLRDYNRKGWVDLYYLTGAGERRLRIDNQKIARFNEIAELICEKKGFENPILATRREDEEEDEGEEQDGSVTNETTEAEGDDDDARA